jgi:hypothetical protein
MTRLGLIPQLAVFALLPLLAACDDSPTSPTDTTSTTSSASTQVFEGTLDIGGSSFYSFSTSQRGTLTASFASLTLVGRSAALPAVMQVGVGIPAGEGCAVTESIDAAPALTSQFSTTLTTGIFCLSIADIGNLPGPVTFSIRFIHP